MECPFPMDKKHRNKYSFVWLYTQNKTKTKNTRTHLSLYCARGIDQILPLRF